MHFARVLRAAGPAGRPRQGARCDPRGRGDRASATGATSTGRCTRCSSTGATSASCSTRPSTSSGASPTCSRRRMQLLLPQIEADAPQDGRGAGAPPGRGARPREAAGPGRGAEEPRRRSSSTRRLSFSPGEVLQHKDFEQMSADEIAQRQGADPHACSCRSGPVPTRRFRPEPRGRRVDLRRTLRQSLRGGGAMIDLASKRRVRRHPPLVILCDISGSMERYSRMLLHFMHAVTNDRDRVHCFVFGTRLTNVTPPAAPARRRPRARQGRRAGPGLVGRHPHRPLPARVQPRLVAPRAGAGRGRAADHRRPRPRRGRRPRARDRAPAQELPPPDLAEPACCASRATPRSPPARARSSSTSTTSGRCTTWRAWRQLTEALGRFGPRREEGISSWRELAHNAAPEAAPAPAHRPLRATLQGERGRALQA